MAANTLVFARATLRTTAVLLAVASASGCASSSDEILLDSILASCADSTVFLSSFWAGSASGVADSFDPMGGSLILYWIDADGNVCHGTPGISGQPGSFEVSAFDPAAMAGASSGEVLTPDELEQFQEIAFDFSAYDASGLHFVQMANFIWRERSTGVTDVNRLLLTFSVPGIVSVDRDAFCVSPVAAECGLGLTVPIPNPFPPAGQHPTKCLLRQVPVSIALSRQERRNYCAVDLPHGLEFNN